MQKGFTQILFVVLFLIAAILFLPLPYYEFGNIVCKPGQTNCRQIGWNLRGPLWKEIFTSFQNKSSSILIPTPDPTENWETYTNNQHNFTIKYPLGFYYQEINQTNTYSVILPIKWLVLLADSKRPINKAHYPEIDIGIITKDKAISLHEWIKDKITVKDNYNNPDKEDKNKIWWGVKELKDDTLVGLPSVKFHSSNGASTYQDNVLMDNGNEIIYFQSVITPLGAIDSNVFAQILSTFKFTQ